MRVSLSDGLGAGQGAGAAAMVAVDPNMGLKVLWRRVLKEVASLPRAIAIMAIITGLSGLGTIVPQNKARAGGGGRRTRRAGKGTCGCGWRCSWRGWRCSWHPWVRLAVQLAQQWAGG